MRALREHQERMFRLVTTRQARAGDPALSSWIRARDDDEAADRLGAYAGMVLRRLVDTLAGTFPRVRQRLGDRTFEELAERYLDAHPSDDPSVGNIGRRFASFVPEEVAGLARIEWARAEAVGAEDATPMRRADLEALAPDAWPALALGLVPSARVVDATLVWRRGFVVQERPVSGGEARALRVIAGAAATFADACEAFAEEPDVILAALERWIADEVLVHRGTGRRTFDVRVDFD